MEVIMQSGLHAIGWGARRLSIAVVGAAFAAILAYAVLIFAIVTIQAVTAFGQ
jgi:hypothetical protein